MKARVAALGALTAIVSFAGRFRPAHTAPEIAVLLGAGTSESLGMPGTAELTQMLDRHYAERRGQFPSDRHAAIFEKLSADLRTEFGDAYNFEVLLDAVESSRQFLDGLPYVRPRPNRA